MTHPPSRPSWTCRTCGQEWPCEPARDALLVAYGGHGRRDLLGYLGDQLLLAEEDLTATLGVDKPSAYVLFGRFLTWARREPPATPGDHAARATPGGEAPTAVGDQAATVPSSRSAAAR